MSDGMKKGKTWLVILSMAGGALGAYLVSRAYQRAKASYPPFHKRIYIDSHQLVESFGLFWHKPEDLNALRRNPRIAHPLAEKIMLAVTSANGARHGSYTLARYCLRQGLSPEAVDSLLRGELGQATMDEAPALFFAQHYAAQRGQPDADMLKRLEESYGPETAHDLVTYVRFVTFGTLVGNTFDAFLSRILGHPSPDMTLRGELITLAVLTCGIMPLIPVLALRVARLASAGQQL
jgi:hypothetical protein